MTKREHLDPLLAAYLDRVLTVCSKRAKFVIEKIKANGSINSDEIQKAGFLHGARTAGDVREQGVPLETNTTKRADKRSIALYVFGLPSDIRPHMFGGRIRLPKSLKAKLLERDGSSCAISRTKLPEKKLQVDHRIPYFVSGDTKDRNPSEFMLLSAQMQRAKSWTCEHCPNLRTTIDKDVCRTCYWAYPDEYTHVATLNERLLHISFAEDEAAAFDSLNDRAKQVGVHVRDFAKSILIKSPD